MEIDNDLKNRLTGLLAVLFPEAKIYLFGSRARGTHGPLSDIDIAIDAGKELEHVDTDEANEIMKALNIAVKVDVVDIYGVTPEMKKAILRDKIVWKS